MSYKHALKEQNKKELKGGERQRVTYRYGNCNDNRKFA